MKSLIESVRAMYGQRTEATMMQDDGKMVHNCAKHVEHVQYGKGNCIAEEHADPDRYGNIAWYDVEFPHGVERGVPITELKVLQAESHGHETKAKKKKMAEGNDGNLANNAAPYDKVTKGDVIAGRLGKDEMGGKKKKAVKEEADQIDELSDKTLGNYVTAARADRANLKTSMTSGDTAEKMDAMAKDKKRQVGMNKAKAYLMPGTAGHAKNQARRAANEEIESVDEKFGGTQNMLNQTTHKNNDPMRRLKVTTDHPRFANKPLNSTSQGILKNRLKAAQGTHSKPNLPEEIDMEQVDETVLHKDVEFNVNLAEKDYKSYFTAAMKGKDLGSMDEPEKKKFFNKVDAGYKAKNEDVFLEAMFDGHINDIIAAHKKAGNRVSDEKSAMSDGKMKHSYVITTPEGKRTRHIHHGSSKKLETMSPAKKSKQSQEQDLDDKD